MTKDEALKLALEALEDFLKPLDADLTRAIKRIEQKTRIAITAIRKALAQPELTLDGLTPTEFALRELYEFQEATGCDTAAEFKAQKEQQRCYCGNIYRLGVVHREHTFCDEHPRKPLTNEDIALINWESLKTKKDCVRAIEAAHGIKE